MRYQTGHAEVVAEGFTQTTAFGIANSGKAFKGLIDGLYSRKIEAAIRELATNAFDAHMAAGSIAPFEVHLPKLLAPTFWIRDYGTGMSHDLITHRYSTMFDSTKDGLNAADASLVSPDKQVGCLGLGSKAFFAYTDTCTITVWQDGKMRVYSVFIGGDGVPQIAYAGSAPSDEPVGVKVEFAVKKKDFDAFRTAAIRVFKGFPVQPAGLPSDVRDALAVAPTEIGSFWKAFPKTYLPDGGFYARQGCVLYPIDLVQIDENKLEVVDDDFDGDEEDAPVVVTLSERYARFKDVSTTIVMDFPIGSLEFDLSRERLAYNERTLRSLRSRWSEFIADLDRVIEREFEGLESRWDRACTARKAVFQSLGPLFAQNSYFAESVTISALLKSLFPKRRSDRSPSTCFFSAIKHEASRHAVQPIYQRLHTGFPDNPNPAEIVLFYKDENAGRQINARINQHLGQVGKEWGLLIDKGRLTARIWRSLGKPPIVRVSQIDQLPREVMERMRSASGALGGGGVFDRVKVIDGNGWRAAHDDEDLDDHLWGFLHRGVHVKLWQDNGYCYQFEHLPMTTADVVTVSTLSEAIGGPTISFINCRSNDKLGRWDALPTFYDHYDRMADSFPKALVGRFVRVWNHIQFSRTHYAKLYSGGRRQTIRDDWSALVRRYTAGKKVEEFDSALHAVCTEKGLEKLRNDLLRVAGDFGFDVLPPGDEPMTLLSPRWEEALEHIKNLRSCDGMTNSFVRNLIRKNAQC